MTPQELKNSILQLAIQGKLVEQRPEEGTGEELYQQIQSEKQALIKAGKIKKEKPLPEITEDEIPFEIPESWKWVRLCTIGNTQTGNTPSKAHPEYQGHDIPFITPGDIMNGNIYYDNQALSLLGKEVARVADSGTILQVCIGGSIGKAAVTEEEVTFNQQINSITPLNCIPDYLYSVMTSQSFIKKMKDSAGGTATPIINRGLWDSLLIPLPPLAEQKRIVAKIEELLPLIDRYEKAWSWLDDFNKRFLEDMQKSILQMAIQGKLVEQRPEEGTGEELYRQIRAEKEALIKAGKIKKEKPLPEITDEEVPFEIPESWKWVRLVEMGWFSSGKTPAMGEAKYWNNGTVDWFTSKDMKKKYLDKSEIKITEVAASGMTKYPAGTLLMVVRSGILKRMLPLCILTRESTINQDIKAYCLYEQSISEYVYYMIKGLETYILNNYRKQVTTVDSLKFEEFSRKMLVPLPPLSEQKRIVARLEELLPLCEKLR